MHQIFEFKSDTIQFVRKQYELDKSERLEEAIFILTEWLNMQTHIVKKDYPKEYLERKRGSVERAKTKLDKVATYRTLLPEFFEPLPDPTKTSILDDVITVFLPQLTKEHYRVFMWKVIVKQFETGFSEFYRYLVMLCEYILAQDYCNGIMVVLDYSETNLYELIKTINVMEMHQALGIIMNGFGMRIKGIHIITSSKAIDSFIRLIKQVLTAKVAERIQVHKSVDSLNNYIPKEILPKDYGGQAKSLLELSCGLRSTLGSEKNMKYLKDMQKACTNEDHRREDKFNDCSAAGCQAHSEN